MFRVILDTPAGPSSSYQWVVKDGWNIADCVSRSYDLEGMTGDGYGRYQDRDGTVAAHRMAFKLTTEWLSFGRLIHTCGNRACCNPRHLREQREEPWEDRFWSKVALGEPTECWAWTGARNAGGYGVLGVGGQLFYAHHLAFELAEDGGGDVRGQCVIHTCGRRSCVNPAHLEVALPSNAGKLSAAGAAAIRRRRAAGESQAGLAREFGISPSMVSRIVRGTRWPDTC